MPKSTADSQKDISQITTYQSGVVQASAHRLINRVVSDYLLQYGLTAMQWFIVGFIYDAGTNGIRLSDLTKKLDTTLPFITNSVNLLESKGIVKKLTHSGDSRIKLVLVTESFRPQVDEIETGLRNHLRQTLYREDGISRQELQDYIAVLYKIVLSANS